jgi:hypothetical protein
LIDCGLAGQRKKREPTEVAIRKIEAKALSAMVRITLRIAGKGAIRKGDEDRFMNAKNLLAKFPALSEKYFTKTPAVHARPPDHFGKGGEITVQNETFDVLDPGRFIGGAKEGTLIPFPFTPGDKTANTAAANAYLEALKRPPKEECEPNPDPANLGAFIDSSETLESA